MTSFHQLSSFHAVCRKLQDDFVAYLGDALASVRRSYSIPPSVPESPLFSRYRFPLSGHSRLANVPRILLLLARQLQVLKAYELEGIFRKNADSNEKQRYLSLINDGEYEDIEMITNGYLGADLMKRLFFLMEEPFIPYALYDEIVNQSSFSQAFCQSVLDRLPPEKRATLCFIIDLLCVYSMHAENAMSFQAFAVCWGPSLMRPFVRSSPFTS